MTVALEVTLENPGYTSEDALEGEMRWTETKEDDHWELLVLRRAHLQGPRIKTMLNPA